MPIMARMKDNELTNVTLPFAFDSNGIPLTALTIIGNTRQTGTPSPQSIIMPTFCGKLVGSDWTIPITSAGQTMPVYLGQVQTVRKIRKLVLDGRENYTEYSFSGTFGAYVSNVLDTKYTRSMGICSHYPVSTSVTVNTLWIGANDTRLYFVGIRDVLGVETAAEVKSWVAQQYQNGTPVTIWYVLAEPETAIVNEPLAKIGDYADELHIADADITIPTVRGSNVLTVDTDLQPSGVSIAGEGLYSKVDKIPIGSTQNEVKHGLDNNGAYFYKAPAYYSWENIREIVRAGKAPQYYPLGSIIYDNFDPATGTAFQVVAYDKHFDSDLTTQGYTHSMTLAEYKITDNLVFDNSEAFLYTNAALPAGTYRFTIPNSDPDYGGNKSYYFTSTADLPAGSQIVMSWPYNQTPKTVSAYSGAEPWHSTSAVSGFSGLTLTEWVDGTSPEATNLGTIAGPSTQAGTSNYGTMNNIHRARYGSNNYLQSGIRQYINSDKAANAWWTAQTVFDRPYSNRNIAGELTKLNSGLVGVMATPEIQSIANTFFETASFDGTTFTLGTKYTIFSDKMFLLAPNEVNLVADTSVGSILDYYVTAGNAKRIKYRKDNGNAQHWWLRTPYPSTANSVRHVLTSGALHNNSAYNTFGCVAACVIQ